MSDKSTVSADGCRKLRVLAVPIAFNEAAKMGSVLDRFNRGDVDQISVFDDGSTDGTASVVAARGLSTIHSAETRGVGNAIRTVIRHARSEGFDVVVILAGNDKDRPQEIPRLLEPIDRGGYDFVQGSRYLPVGCFNIATPFARPLPTRTVHPFRSHQAGIRGDGSSCFENSSSAPRWLHQDEANHGMIEHSPSAGSSRIWPEK